MKSLCTLVVASALAFGCAHGRSPELYRDDTQKLFDTKSGDIKTCYDGVLKTDAKAAGRVTVTFAFKEDSGALVDAKIDSGNTTAPAAVSQCVLSNLNGIVLNPADKHRGEGTWSWEFKPAS